MSESDWVGRCLPGVSRAPRVYDVTKSPPKREPSITYSTYWMPVTVYFVQNQGVAIASVVRGSPSSGRVAV